MSIVIMKKKVLIVTYIDFWRGGAGHISRLNAIIDHLRQKHLLSVVYIGSCLPGDESMLESKYGDLDFHFLEKNANLTIAEYVQKFAVFILDKVFDIALLEYIEMYALLNFFQKKTVKILDTHDLLIDKIASFNKYGLTYDGLKLSFEQELAVYKEFDRVILINEKDYNRITQILGREKTLFIPHPVKLDKVEPRPIVKNIIYVASLYSPNVDAINWFLGKVWPVLSNNNITLKIYGHVGKKINPELLKDPSVKIEGFKDDLTEAYKDADIVINPVRAGAGLKIKNIEALGYGLPLVTTTHGMSGLEGAALHSLLLADTAEDFVRQIIKLITDFSLRTRLSAHAFQYANLNFSSEKCFEPLDEYFLTL